MPSTGALMLLTALHTCDQVRGPRSQEFTAAAEHRCEGNLTWSRRPVTPGPAWPHVLWGKDAQLPGRTWSREAVGRSAVPTAQGPFQDGPVCPPTAACLLQHFLHSLLPREPLHVAFKAHIIQWLF